MTVAIVVSMFALILVVDYVVAKAKKPAEVKKPVEVWTAPRLVPAVVGA